MGWVLVIFGIKESGFRKDFDGIWKNFRKWEKKTAEKSKKTFVQIRAFVAEKSKIVNLKS